VDVDAIAGRPRRRAWPSRSWFCVWAVLAIQIEGRRKGMVTVEDRLVLVKALGAADVEKRVRRKIHRETEPYFNSDGELLRCQLVSVKDALASFDAAIDPDGAEMYSRLRRTHMRPELTWPS
jgi:hypothetical protein